MGRVGIKEAATVSAQQLDRFLRGHRPHRQRLGLGGRDSITVIAYSSFNGWPSGPFLAVIGDGSSRPTSLYAEKF